jgi:hypothetical protein
VGLRALAAGLDVSETIDRLDEYCTVAYPLR